MSQLLHSMENSNLCHQIIGSPKTYVLGLQVHGRESISKNAEQFSFRNVGDDSRSNISFCASLGWKVIRTIGLHVNLIVNVCTRRFILHGLLST